MMNLLMIIMNLSGILQHIYTSYHSNVSTKIQQQSYQDQLSTDSTKQESHDVLSSSTVTHYDESTSTGTHYDESSSTVAHYDESSSTVTHQDESLSTGTNYYILLSSILTNHHVLSPSTVTNHNVSSSSLIYHDDVSAATTYYDISAASTTELVCKYSLRKTCDSCISSKNSTGKGSFQYCQKNGHCYELHQNYTSLCQTQCGGSMISTTHNECADFQRITTVVIIIYILLLIICPLLLILSCFYICVLRCRAILLNKIHVGNDDVDDTPVRLIQLHNSAPVNIHDGVVHPTTAVRVGNNNSDEYVIYAQAEIDVDDDDDDDNGNRSGRVKIYRGYDLHTV